MAAEKHRGLHCTDNAETVAIYCRISTLQKFYALIKVFNKKFLITSLQVSEFESPSRFTVLETVDEVKLEHRSSFSLTRDGKDTRPPIKFQDFEWKTVKGRGKRGRHGRSSSR